MRKSTFLTKGQKQSSTLKLSVTLHGQITSKRDEARAVARVFSSMVLSVCRTQASIALSSCEAELHAANGLMVECMFLYRLLKFLYKDFFYAPCAAQHQPSRASNSQKLTNNA